MIGTGASLNVAVAGSLVLYRLAGLLYRYCASPLLGCGGSLCGWAVAEAGQRPTA